MKSDTILSGDIGCYAAGEGGRRAVEGEEMEWSACRIDDSGGRTDLSGAVVSYAFGPRSLLLTLAVVPWLQVVAPGDVVEVTCRAPMGTVWQSFRIGWVERQADDGEYVAHGQEIHGGSPHGH